jgi:hypothetical protein
MFVSIRRSRKWGVKCYEERHFLFPARSGPPFRAARVVAAYRFVAILLVGTGQQGRLGNVIT